MHYHLLGLMLLGGTASSALAQGQPWVQPGQPAGFGGTSAPGALANLQARLDAIERQLARLTGQNEESAHRIRQLEAQLQEARRQSDERLARIEAAAAAAPALTKAEPEEAAPDTVAVIEKKITVADPKPAGTGDAGEDAYLVGFRQWENKDFGEAQKSLEAMAKKYPKHARASYALNLAGRAYLDDGKPATAAKILLSNYQANPKGERAADSLYFLGQALMQLNKPAEACRVYDELGAVYPKMRDWVKERLPAAREEAKCGS
ncbi:MAG TPA: YbgF trimerization domain-containing protein [Allosphingosinicella sp.]|jgi:TolA-binding protein